MAISIPSSPIPEICVSLAPFEAPLPALKSPFDSIGFQSVLVVEETDNYRPTLLTPPLASPSRMATPLSPLRPVDTPMKGQGLERERFEALLKASRERNAMVGAKKGQDLRKEIALKAHKSKQNERRALFLSKLNAPPCPTAAATPKTPPESPAILHYTLPSPGLHSPLALFETISHHDAVVGKKREAWVEQVDFRLPEAKRSAATAVRRSSNRTGALPSLDQISARLSAQRQLAAPVVPTIAVIAPDATDNAAPTPTRRLPAFLKPQREQQAPIGKVEVAPAQQRAPLPIGVGRLQLPIRAPKPEVAVAVAPKSPGAPPSPLIRVTTTVVPRTTNTSPDHLTESNLTAFNSRARTAKDMLSTLRRRTVSGLDGVLGGSAPAATEEAGKLLRRRSAPAEVQRCERRGFEHPILALPGGF